MEYKIEKGIELPGKRWGMNHLTTEFNALNELEAGDSFEFETTEVGRIRTAIAKQKSLGFGKKFATRKTSETKSRVWRLL